MIQIQVNVVALNIAIDISLINHTYYIIYKLYLPIEIFLILIIILFNFVIKLTMFFLIFQIPTVLT